MKNVIFEQLGTQVVRTARDGTFTVSSRMAGCESKYSRGSAPCRTAWRVPRDRFKPIFLVALLNPARRPNPSPPASSAPLPSSERR